MANEDSKTEEYEVEGIGTVMLDKKDAEAFGKRAKKVSTQAPDPTAAQRKAEADAVKAATAANKAAAAPANKAAPAPADKSGS